jgi:chemotaxis signal transduction protein
MTAAPDVAAQVAALRSAFDATFAAPARRDAAALERLLAFRVGEQTLAARLGTIAAVEALPRLAAVPGAPAELLGLAGIRGRLVPVFSLALLIGGDGTETPRWLLVCGSDEPIGLAVSGVDGYVHVPAADVVPGTKDRHPHVHEFVRVGELLRGVVDLASVRGQIERRAAGEDGPNKEGP